MSNRLKKAFFIFFPLIIGGIVGFIIKDAIDYNQLVKPPLAPPSILFPIAWTIIYLLMGISYYILQKGKTNSKTSLVYYTQLFINALWSIFFFSFKWQLFSCFWIVLLDIFIILMIYLFQKQSKIAAYLNIPYLLWCLFATYLTFGIYLLN